MKRGLSVISKSAALVLLIIFQFSYTTLGQSTSNPICQEGDCSPNLFSIQLNDPLNPGQSISPQRTANFKKAYQSFQQIRKTYAQNEGWDAKRAASQLGGKNCLRHYQLEAQFTYEYTQNPDFKSFVDGVDPNANNYTEYGFESSRRGLNLEKRMDNNCPDKVREVKKKEAPALTDLPSIYQKLGRDLGYFDEQGNLLKPLSTAPAPTGNIKMSKKQQVENLKAQVAQLPLGQDMKNKVGGIQNALGNALPQVGNLQGALSGLSSNIGSFLPSPTKLLGNVGTMNNAIGAIKNFKPKLPLPNLLSKIGDLFKRGKDLGGKAKDLVNNANKLKDKLDGISKKTSDLLNKLKDQKKTVDYLQNQLNDLAQKKAELEKKLADKPKKILDELKSQVADIGKKAKDLADGADKENKLKDNLLDQLKNLNGEKDKITDELNKLKEKLKALDQLKNKMEQETKDADEEVEKAKEEEEKIEALKQELEDLKSEEELKAEISDCENELKKFLTQITGIGEKQKTFKEKIAGFFSKPAKLLDKLSNIKLLQNKLKLPKNGIPIANKALAKVDELTSKANALGSTLEIFTGKKTKFQTKMDSIDARVKNLKSKYDAKSIDLESLKKELATLISEKIGLKDKLIQSLDPLSKKVSQVKDFIDRFNIFDKKTDCEDNKELEEEINETKKSQGTSEQEINELEKEINEIEADENALENQTQELEKDIESEVQKAADLKKEEEAIKSEFGKEVKLEPVTVEEWAESFEVQRPYWDAVFHPDEEVIAGQKGRYFEVKLKDANKNVKLLFGPGQYCMSKSEFRKKYGSTIGSFVSEALHAMKKADQQKVKLFIQGSADIAGHKTFSGNLDEQFSYEQIQVLPQKGSDERFDNTTVAKTIPKRNFKNDHLPNLRGQYLKEMIKIYSKKFDPQVLEGKVKEFNDEEERNAIIYLFIPEELLSEYSE